MIDIRLIRESPDAVRSVLSRRAASYEKVVDRLVELDAERRQVLGRSEQLKAERNRASEEVGRLKKQQGDVSTLTASLKGVSAQIKELDKALGAVEAQLEERMLQVPNLPLDEVPVGDASANQTIREWGTIPEFDFEPAPHWDLGSALRILDLPRGARIAGSGFPVFLGMGAKLGRALTGFMLDMHTTEHGYVEVSPPLMVNEQSARGTGQLPDLEGQMYVTTDGLYLVPTAEVPVTNLHAGEILSADELPKAYVAYTPCFRREAGAHGKETRGILRVHQFDKVELVRITTPQDSPTDHELMLGHAEAVLERLELPYRVVVLATGDMGFASAKTYDIEVWAPGVQGWLEVSSASTFTDFQARRANIRYRPSVGAKPSFVHTLNASGLALPRLIVALLENNQQSDGSVRIPAALVPYLGVDRLTPNGGS